AAPVVLEKAVFGRPAEADGGWLRLCPAPIDTAIDHVHERANLRLLGIRAVEIGLTEERTGEQDGGIDRRQFTVLEPLPGLHVQEMVEEPLVTAPTASLGTLRSVVEEPQGRKHALPSLLAGDIAALDADRVRG